MQAADRHDKSGPFDFGHRQPYVNRKLMQMTGSNEIQENAWHEELP